MSWQKLFQNPLAAPFKRHVNSQYGAPMGRHSDKLEEFVGRAHLQRVPFVDGDYDPGGAYWDTTSLCCLG